MPIALLRRINERIIIFLDYTLVMTQTLKFGEQRKFFCYEIWVLWWISKISNTSEGSRVFGVSDKFSKHGVSLNSGKNFRYPKQMHATYNTWNLVISGKDKTYQCPGAHCIEIAILTFTKGKSVTAIYLQIENMTGLSYLVRIGGGGGGGNLAVNNCYK